MSRKIKIQTINPKNLEETLKKNLTELKSKDGLVETNNIVENALENNTPCIENTGDAIASTNNDISITTNAYNIKRQYLIKKFKDIILDVTTDDFTDNMSPDEKIIKTSRRDGIILEEDFQTFIDVINIEKFGEITDVPEDIYNLTAKLHANKEYFNRVNVIRELAGYYNFLINKLFIPIENIIENSYFFKLADKYISNYNKFEFNIPNENIDNFAQSASTNYKNIMSKINSISDEKNDYKKYREYFNSEDNIKFNKLTGEKIKPINDVTEEFKQAKIIGDAFKTFRDENDVTKHGKLEDVKTILKNISKNNNISNIDNKVGDILLSIPEENTDTLNSNVNTKHYEEVNHPDHYNVYDVEVVEMMERIFGIKETMSWCKLNAFKYRMRAGEKPTSTVEKDLKKEKWCLNKYKELKSKN